jgi:hypothetical protein
MLWMVLTVLGGCDRLECDLLVGDYCKNAVMCCPMIKDDVTGDCYIEAMGENPVGWPCRGADCDNALAQWSEHECDFPEYVPATQTGPKP